MTDEVTVDKTTSPLRRRRKTGELAVRGFLYTCGILSIAVTIGILWELGSESYLFFQDERVSILEFITGTEWLPKGGSFGIWPLVLGTFYISFIALVVAVPVGLAAAIYLSEYASRRVRGFFKPVLEVLVGIPTVVFGYFALTFMTPLLRDTIGTSVVGFFNILSAGIVVGILVVPLVSSLAEDALSAVPDSLRQAAYAMGASKMEVSLRVVVPAALSGIAAGVVVAMSRAVGETMVVTLAAGASARNFALGEDSLFGYILNPFQGAQAMTGYIAITASGDLAYNTIDYNSIFAIGLALFLITFALNALSRWFVNRYRQKYE
ncbi:MAG: phosphate ABC transporter permease subunit PstC [Actinobacteria bacterium]|nr:phosphate ABC transporter permease subunit PstC [Actinomycetota bacterium]MCI0543037.1 phosphate ABC transporter permease subunit PstC [Actinomycetota bacterium]MCI0678824.1 phosphate ABC transporter permease subunit PstC [Actinomycetota bacterium]